MLRIQGQKFSPWWYCVDFKLWCRFWPCGKLSWSTCWRNLTRCAYDTSAAWALRLDAHFIRCILCFQSSRGAACGGTHSGVNLLFWARAHASYSKQGHCQRQTCFELVPDLITTWCQHLITMSTGRVAAQSNDATGDVQSAFPAKVKLTFKGRVHVASLRLDPRMRTIENGLEWSEISSRQPLAPRTLLQPWTDGQTLLGQSNLLWADAWIWCRIQHCRWELLHGDFFEIIVQGAMAPG